MAEAPEGVETVGLVVDASDTEIEALLQAVSLDVLQLHGYETPERVAEIALRFGCRVMKALRAETPEDLAALPVYAEAADMILLTPSRPGTRPSQVGTACPSTGGCSKASPWTAPGYSPAGCMPETWRRRSR